MHIDRGDDAPHGQTDQASGYRPEEPPCFEEFDAGELIDVQEGDHCLPPGACPDDVGRSFVTDDGFGDQAQSWHRREAWCLESTRAAADPAAFASFKTNDGFEDACPCNGAAVPPAVGVSDPGATSPLPASSVPGPMPPSPCLSAGTAGPPTPASSAPCPMPQSPLPTLLAARPVQTWITMPCILPVWGAGVPLVQPYAPAPPPAPPSAAELDARARELAAEVRRLQAAADEVRRVSREAEVSAGSAGPSSSVPKASIPAMKETDKASTSVLLRNIPNDYSRRMLLELLDTEGFAGRYDFVYLPVDFKRKAGLGYAFVNLVDTETAERFIAHFDGFRRWRFASQKVCAAGWDKFLQGLGQQVEHYRNSPLMHESLPDEFRPVLFRQGVRVEFPQPSKRIRRPRVSF